MLDVFLYTGLRRGDAAQVGRQHVSNGFIQVDTENTGRRVTIPLLPELHATLNAGPVGDLAFIATAEGNPMTKESLGNAFRDACRAAGIKKSAHGLRKSAATNAANHGASEKQSEAIFGWAGGQMASLYTRSANRKALSKGAADMLARDESRTSSAGAGAKNQVISKGVLGNGALERTRTFTNFFTATSRQRVYQFRHERL